MAFNTLSRITSVKPLIDQFPLVCDLTADRVAETPAVYDAAETRRQMAEVHGLKEFLTDVHIPAVAAMVESDMQVVEL